ncbi:MAG: 1,4-beta-xylanase, partial [Pedobacter sp.]
MNVKLNKLQLGVLMLFLGTLLISGIKKTDGLKDYYKKYFPIGVAVKPSDLRGKEKSLILEQFNSITAENAMKMGPIHPSENRYFWPIADSIVEFGVANKIKVRGHCLVWHTQTPFWLFKDSVGQQVSKEVLLG